MITLNELAYNIKNIAYGGFNSKEENLDIRQIKHWIHYHRAKIISENISKGILSHHEIYQHYELNAFTMYDVPVIDFATDYLNWRKDTSGSVTAPDPTSALSYSVNGVEFLSFFPKDSGSGELTGKFPSKSSMTYGTTPENQHTLDQRVRDPYGRFKREHQSQLDGDFRNSGIALFSIPQILMLDNYRSVKNITINRNPADANALSGADTAGGVLGNMVSKIDIPIDTGISSRFRNNPSATISSHKISKFRNQDDESDFNNIIATDRDKGYSLLEIKNLQVSPNYFNNKIFSDPTKVVYKRHKFGRDLDEWSDKTSAYPIPMEYVQDLIQRVISTEMGVLLKTSSDFIDDAADTSKIMSVAGRQQGGA